MSLVNDVLRIVKQVPEGKVITYKDIAQALRIKSYRAVGQALKKNPDLISTPCHRVVRSDGRVGGYVLGSDVKIKLLKSEGVIIKNGRVHSSCFHSLKKRSARFLTE